MNLENDHSPLRQWTEIIEGYWVCPKLEGEIFNKPLMPGDEIISWNNNDYLSIASDQSLFNIKKEGSTFPLGSQPMTGNKSAYNRLETKLALHAKKEQALFLTTEHQGMVSIIDTLLKRNDVVIYDAECHAYTIDGVKLHEGLRLPFKHNDIGSLEKCLERAEKHCATSRGTILVISEGIFSMRGDQGKIKEIAKLKKKHSFTFMLDDAYGFGILGKSGRGTHEHQGVANKVDLYFATFTKAMASTGGFIAGSDRIIQFLRNNTSSQNYSPTPSLILISGLEKRLDTIIKATKQRKVLNTITNSLQNNLRQSGFNLGTTNTYITPIHLKGTPYEAKAIVRDLRKTYKVFCSMVFYPVAQKGEIILRLIPTCSYTEEDIDHTIFAFTCIANKLARNEYSELTEQYKTKKG
ncbi:MAG: aminotransferase class I/II-fold pyridoxal phosphate-dependent enzyme [Crocinitomicaceae bacterium]|nr:aminotransferase class I/II-fold pyridoxal phosphate-dependent enzyme [Crocinitomicaceae bacterium]